MSFLEQLKTTKLLADGAIGTALQGQGVTLEPPDLANHSKATIVRNLHRAYVEAGADLLTTNTFRGITLEEADVIANTEAAIRLVKEANPTYIGLSLGPIGEADLSQEKLAKYLSKYQLIAKIGAAEYVDLLLLETFYAEAEVLAVAEHLCRVSHLPLFVSLSLQGNGLTFAGTPLAQLVPKLETLGIAGIGLNCLEMSQELVGLAQQLRQLTDLPLLIQGNAGLPIRTDEGLEYPSTDHQFCEYAAELFELDNVIIGGCCGTTPATIKALSQRRATRAKGELYGK